MPSQFRVRVILVCVLAMSIADAGRAESPAKATQFSGQEVTSAEQLVQKIIAEERRVDEVESFYLRMEGTWTKTPEGIAARKSELQLQQLKFPSGIEITEENFPELRPVSRETLEMAWDDTRIRKLNASPGDRFDLRIWDGNRAAVHEIYFANGQEHIAFDKSPHRFLSAFIFSDLSWLRMQSHSLWFLSRPADLDKAAKFVYGRPEDYFVSEESDFGGRRCLVLQNVMARRRLFVGLDDHRLYGVEIRYLPKEAVRSSEGLKRFSQIAGREFANHAELDEWVSGLSGAKREEYDRRNYATFFEFTRPLSLHYLDDYREIAPELWFPAKQGYTVYKTSGDEQIESAHRDLWLVDSKVNEPLDDNLFAIQPKDGVQVHDWRHNPPRHYIYQADPMSEK